MVKLVPDVMTAEQLAGYVRDCPLEPSMAGTPWEAAVRLSQATLARAVSIDQCSELMADLRDQDRGLDAFFDLAAQEAWGR